MALGAGPFSGTLSIDATDRLYGLFREADGTTFDTAHCYCFWLPSGAGSAERALGQCIRRHGDTANVRIITKGGHPAAGPDYPRPDAYLSPELLASDIADSLRWLDVPTIDLYLLHRDDSRVPVGEIIDALNTHIAAGRLRSIGVSNWSTARLAAANDYVRAHNLRGFVVSQPQFNLAHPNATIPNTEPALRYLTDADIAWHTHTGMPVVCYSPTANGYFASNGQRGRDAYENSTTRARLGRATSLAQELKATPNQIALAYLLSQPFPTIPILGTADPAHLTESLAAADIHLTAAQLTWLRDGR